MTHFDQRAKNPYFWFKQAMELDSAAKLIWSAIRQDLEQLTYANVGTVIELKQVPHANLGGVFWLNAGLALENLFKGVIVQNNPSLVVGGTIARSLRTHDLLKLAKKALITIDSTKVFFLQIGTDCITWAGRYPCSIKSGDSKPLLFSEADVIAYREMFDHLVGRLDNTAFKSVSFTRLV